MLRLINHVAVVLCVSLMLMTAECANAAPDVAATTATTSSPASAVTAKVVVSEFVPAEPQEVSPRITVGRARISVDGDLADWANVPAVVLDKTEQANGDGGKWNGPADCSGSARLAYDSDYLYLAFDVTDDVFQQPFVDDNTWSGDCVQFAISPLEDRKAARQTPDDQEFTLALTSKGPQLYRGFGPTTGLLKNAKISAVRTKDGGGVRYEVAIPWAELSPLALQLRKSFGFTFTINDNDDGSARAKSYLEWTPGIQKGKTPATYGQAVIEYASPSAGKAELFIASNIVRGPDVSELNLRVARMATAAEKLPFHVTLSTEGKTVLDVDETLELSKGANLRQITVQLAGIPDGLYDGVVSLSLPGGELASRKFQYFRFASAPVREQIVGLKADIAKLAQAKNPLYLQYAPSLTYRIQVADKWIAIIDTAKRAGNLKSLLDETRQIITDFQTGKDAFASRRGHFIKSYIAPEDDSVQPYRLVIPPDYDATKEYPLVVWLHGNGGAGMTFDLWYLLTLGKEFSARPGCIVALPYGRGNSGYQLLGRNDTFHVIDEVRKAYKIDPNRIYVVGFSMGGSGTWYMTSRYPDLWAGGAPRAGGVGLGEWSDPKKSADQLTDWREQLARANTNIAVFENLLNVPMFVFHGVSDPVVPVANSQSAFDRLCNLGYNTVNMLSVQQAHSSPKYADEMSVDWLLKYSRQPAPAQVRYRTFDLRYNKAYWIEIDEQEKDYQLSEVQAGYADGKVTVSAANVNRLTLEVAKEMLADGKDLCKDLQIVVNGAEIAAKDVKSGTKLHLTTSDGGKTWAISPDQYRAGVIKKHGLSGPISEALGDKFIIIYGTGGTDEMTAANRQAAEAFANGIPGPGGTEMYGNYVAVADTDVSDAQAASANLILYGGPESNKFARAMADKLPVAIKDGKITLRCKDYAATA
ncbi:MAG: hypothetical protein EHM48_03715, partial [Planctomycetaceae bacterium]